MPADPGHSRQLPVIGLAKACGVKVCRLTYGHHHITLKRALGDQARTRPRRVVAALLHRPVASETELATAPGYTLENDAADAGWKSGMAGAVEHNLSHSSLTLNRFPSRLVVHCLS